MLLKPLEEKPKTCGMCELTSVQCDMCSTKNPHCMKWHAETIPGTTPCEWRSAASQDDVMKTLVFANRQLAEHYSLRHMRKKWGTIRGVTTRLTINRDLFGDRRTTSKVRHK